MTSQAANVLRSRVDALRLDARSNARLGKQMENDLTSVLSSRGVLAQGRDAAHDSVALHDAGGVHLCPWSTCQATRHSKV